jgi:putative flippase GtrA
MSNFISKKTVLQFLKFAVIGVLNTATDLCLLNIMVFLSASTDGIGYTIQKAISALCAVVVSYFLNKNWAFDDKNSENSIKKFSAFFMVSLTGMVINVGTASAVVFFLKPLVDSALNNPDLLNDTVWVNLGALAGTAVSMIFNFIGYKIHVFKK